MAKCRNFHNIKNHTKISILMLVVVKIQPIHTEIRKVQDVAVKSCIMGI